MQLKTIRSIFLILPLIVSLGFFDGFAGTDDFINFSETTVMVPKGETKVLEQTVLVLKEEVYKRTGLELKSNHKFDPTGQQQIIIFLGEDQVNLPTAWKDKLSSLKETDAEGYKLLVLPEEKKILLSASDKRGALYGVGKLLRMSEMRTGELLVPAILKISSSPTYKIRGHQLGYRPKTNSYDAWSALQFDQYIRELALFGANSIEIMPPRTDDDFMNQHMEIPALEMIAAQSKSCDAYDLDVWMWYPNMSMNYTHPDSVAQELEERREVFKSVQRLDHLFVPGGDPGDLEPDVLFAWLEKVSVLLNEYHPKAKIWVSPQVFRPTKQWLDTFYRYINEKPKWLGGVVFGPWIKTPIDEMREIVRKDIPIRRYPDITHSLSSQYPVPKWDLAFAVTLGRECINPRPTGEKAIHNALDQYADGSISYSEGTNDDVNKFVWSDQDWNPETPVIETMRDYARFFIGPDYTENIAQGLMSLEKNLEGSLLVSEQVRQTLMQWQDIEQKSDEKVQINFRYQMGLIRAYFDAYTQKRLVYETYLEQQALDQLALFDQTSISDAVAACKNILAQAWETPENAGYKMRCEILADELYESIGAQLTVEKHGAAGGRGNFIDNIDNPLNNAAWIYAQLSGVEKAPDTQEKEQLIKGILRRSDPGPGGFYDNFGNPAAWERVLFDYDLAKDPGNLRTPRVSFGVGLAGEEWVHEITASGFEGDATPVSWMNQVTALYDQVLRVRYENLNPNEEYMVKIAYTGRFRSRMKMTADDLVVHDFIQTGVQPIYEFPVPKQALADGEVVFSWTCGEAERGAQISEIWIIKKQ